MIQYVCIYLIISVLLFILSDTWDYKAGNCVDKITIIIPLETNITGALQTYKSVIFQRDIEVYIIMSVNGVNSEQIAAKFDKKVEANRRTKVLSCQKKGKASAINHALKYVNTEWFGVIDSDCELQDANSLRILCDSTEEKTIAVGGRLMVRKKWNRSR